LNIQPVLSTTAACLLFSDRLGKTFYPWAAVAVVGGMVLVGLTPFSYQSLDAGAGFALLCALCWGLSTVAGRGVMVEMSLPLASGLRVVVGLISMVVLVAASGELHGDQLWTAVAASHAGKTVTQLVLLATLSGGVPLLVYFKGLELTRASTAGYFEMMQTLVAVVITWVFFGQGLAWYQVIAAVVLIGAVALVQRAQQQTALPYTELVSIPVARPLNG
ncbi:MAG TPA: DMT family transporter, partial [Kofleriaceae bacterium]